jgi:hypothetical protein
MMVLHQVATAVKAVSPVGCSSSFYRLSPANSLSVSADSSGTFREVFDSGKTLGLLSKFAEQH